jgi:tellurite methyltransferase
MESDRRRWNEKYRTRDTSGETVAPIVSDHHCLAGGNRALDIAAGVGQNAIFLAEKGFTVTAVDISEVALRPLSGLHPRLHPLCLDLDLWDPPENHFHLIINLRYLNRRLFNPITAALVVGGILIFETFITPPPARNGASHRRAYLLRENELRKAFSTMEVLYYNESTRQCAQGEGKVASLVARRR